MKIACVILGILFLLAAWWQRNDASQYKTADWGVIGWVTLYLFTAFVSFFSAWKPLPRWFYLTIAIPTLLNSAYRFLAIQWDSSVLFNEKNPAGNESGGLLLIGVWFLILFGLHSGKSTSN